MEAEITRNGDITVISLKGHINYEATEPFRRSLERFRAERVVFNLNSLSFVGSSGITIFVDLLRDFAGKTPARPKFCGVGVEFRKVFAASSLAPVEIYDSPQTAALSFTNDTIQPTFFLAPRPLPAFGDDPEWLEDGTEVQDTDPETIENEVS